PRREAQRAAGAPPVLVPAQGRSPAAHAATPAPRAPGGSQGAGPVMTFQPELRRLTPNVVALRVSPQARWVIIRSETPLDVSRAERLPEVATDEAVDALH
ncbi:hypothetical protein KRR26_36270, partial [Corallococcus sp. M34]|nr:hypothetical protein [Citreicoccus inhibens]